MDADVIIVGAGLSGLSAAKWLTKNGVKVFVFEARDRVGGRLLTKKSSHVDYVDLGGSYIGPTQDRILRMAKELGIEHYEVNEVEDILYYKNGKVWRDNTSIPRQNIFVDMDLNNILRLLEKMAGEIQTQAPWNAPQSKTWDTISFKQFLDEKCWTRGARDYLKYFLNINSSSEPYEASLLSVIWNIKQCGGMKRIHSGKNGAQERKFVGGSQQICEKLVEAIEDAEVHINSPVVEINQEQDDCVFIRTLKGNKYTAKYAVLACPPAVQTKIHFSPSLPPLYNQLIQRMPMGACMKIIMYYKTAFWRVNGLCGTMFIEGGDNHPVYSTMDDTKPNGNHPALLGFISTEKLCRLIHLSSEERRDLFAKSLSLVTGCVEALKPIHYEEKSWMEEQYSGGCYTAIYGPGFFTRYGKVLRKPIGKVYLASTETATRWSGYMDGAVEAGERAAREILHSMGKIKADEIWVEEAPSKDVVAEPFQSTWSEKCSPSIPCFIIVTVVIILILTLCIAYFLKP